MKLTIEQIASVCHDANASYCRAIGDTSQKSWSEADEWQRQSAISGVKYALDNTGAKPDSQHNAWLASKLADGWKYGPIKDPVKKEHPCMISYEELPIEQRLKDSLFIAVVRSLV